MILLKHINELLHLQFDILLQSIHHYKEFQKEYNFNPK